MISAPAINHPFSYMCLYNPSATLFQLVVHKELPSQVGLISGGEDHQGLVRSPIDPIQLTIVNHQCKLNTPIPELDCYFLMCVIVCVSHLLTPALHALLVRVRPDLFRPRKAEPSAPGSTGTKANLGVTKCAKRSWEICVPKLDAPNPFHNPSTRENTNHLKHPRSHWARAPGSDEMSQGSEEEATWQEVKMGSPILAHWLAGLPCLGMFWFFEGNQQT